MENKTDRSERFISKWEKRRKQKYLYAFVHGSLYWGLSTAVLSFLLIYGFDFQSLILWRFVIYAIMYLILGFGFGYLQFKRNESAYIDLTDGSMIRKGILDLKSSLPWTYENITIFLDPSNTLNLGNILFWQQNVDKPSFSPDDYIQNIMEDYQKLQKNKDFRDFSSDKTIKVSVFNDSSDGNPIVEKIIDIGKY